MTVNDLVTLRMEKWLPASIGRTAAARSAKPSACFHSGVAGSAHARDRAGQAVLVEHALERGGVARGRGRDVVVPAAGQRQRGHAERAQDNSSAEDRGHVEE